MRLEKIIPKKVAIELLYRALDLEASQYAPKVRAIRNQKRTVVREETYHGAQIKI